MEENVIFTPSQNSEDEAASSPPPSPSEPIEETAAPDEQVVPDEVYEEDDEEEESPLKGILIKAGIGIGIAVIVLFGFFRFILPRFLGASNQHVTIMYYGLWEDPAVMRTVISDFEKKNPTISVKYEKQDVKQYRERLVTRINQGNGPDVFRFHNTWTSMLSSYLAPLPESVIKADEVKKLYPSVVQMDMVRGGGLYGLPLSMDTLSLFVNDDLLKFAGVSVPTTWEDFIQAAKILTTRDEATKAIKTSGASLGTFDNVTHAPDIIAMLMAQEGVNFSELEKTPEKVSRALTFYTNFAKGDSGSWDPTLEQSQLAFAKGNVGMYFGYSWDIFVIKAVNPNLNFSVHSVPPLPGRDITIASYWAEGISSKSKNQKAAQTFLHYLADPLVQQKLYTETAKTRLFGELYARNDLAETLKQNELVYPFVNQAPGAVSSYFAADTYDNGINSHANAYLKNAVTSILGNTSADSATETLIKGVLQVRGQYGR